MSALQRIAVIGYVWPEPNSSAAGQNMLNLLQLFVEAGYQVSFICAANDSIHATNLDAMGIEVHTTQINDDSFDALIKAVSPDVVMFDRFMIEEQFSWRVKMACPNAMLVLNTEDLHSLRAARQNAVKQGYDARDANLNTEMAHREIASILRADLTLIISRAELRLLIDEYQVPTAQLIYFPLHVDSPETSLPDFNDRHGFMTIGNFRHEPNWDAVRYLRESIWPEIRRALPHAQLALYGAYPAKKVTNLHNEKIGFHVKGWVENAHQAIAKHRVMLAPMRFGAGVKGKLVSAMLTQTPSVTTWVGAEGLGDSSSWPGAVCDDPAEFAAHAVNLHKHASQWKAANDKSSNILHQYTDKGRHRQTLVSTVGAIHAALANHRSGLFLQQMMWHHSVRSAQFMSQWITAKNRLI